MPENVAVYEMGELSGGWPAIDPAPEYFFLAAGSDQRAYHVLKTIAKERPRVVLLDYAERKKGVSGSDRYYDWRKLSVPIKPFTCSIADPSDALGRLVTEYKDITPDTPVAIDFSCFTSPYMFTFLHVFREHFGLKDCLALYTEPETYLFADGRYSFYKSSSGSLSLTELPGFPGTDKKSAPSALVVLLGFDGERSQFVLEFLAPKKTIAINGLPSYLPKFKDVSLVNNEKLLNTVGPQHALMYADATNPFQTFNTLHRIKKEHSDTALVIAPLGTKPMNLGACLFALSEPTVRVVYPTPQKYASVTTRVPWRSWYYRLPLDDL